MGVNEKGNNLIADDAVAMRLLQEKYQDIIEKDSLTGAYNRRGFYSHTYELLCDNRDISYEICCINIDKFKLVNDLFGTFAGDKLLTFISKNLKDFVGNRGTMARLNADNFAVCIPVSTDGHEAITGKIKEWLSDYPLPISIVARCGFYHIHDIEVPISIMCDRANMAIMEIKGSYGRDYALYDDKIRNRILEEQDIINDMKFALDDEQFVVYYQPKVNMESGKLIGSEALVRWFHPEKGMISPGKFIPVFEKNGFIASVDGYVWECVCRDIREWLDKGYDVCPVSINVSRAELYNKDLVSKLGSLVKKYNIPTRLLQLEITESAYMESPEQLIQVTKELKDTGFTILMDDFGSGYSSLNILKDVPVDVLKLDLKFLYNMDHNLKANYILKSVIQMAMRLELYVIAEGVETEDQAEFLQSIGCVRAQGYLYAKPMPKKDLEEYLSASDRVDITDGDMKSGLVNMDDIMSTIHREDELEWYRASVIQMKARLYEYNVSNDIYTIYDVPMEGDSGELSKAEVPHFKNQVISKGIVYPDDVNKAMSILERMEDFPGTDFRVTIPGSRDRYSWKRISGRVIRTSDGKPSTIVGVMRDVSDEKASDLVLNIMETFEQGPSDKSILSEVLQLVGTNMMFDRMVLSFPKCSINVRVGCLSWSRYQGVAAVSEKDKLEYYDECISKLKKGAYDVSVIQSMEMLEYDFSNDKGYEFVDQTAGTGVFLRLALGADYVMNFVGVFDGRSVKFDKDDCRRFSEVAKIIGKSSLDLINVRQKQETYELYESAFTSSGINFWEWNVESGLLRRSSSAASADGRGEYISNVPYSFVENGEIHPDFIEEYIGSYRALSQGRDATVMVKKLNTDDRYHWLRIGYHVVADDQGNPVKAIGYGEDMEQILTRQATTRYNLSKLVTDERKEVYWIRADITDDIIDSWYVGKQTENGSYGYQTAINNYAQSFVDEEYRDEFMTRLSRQELLRCYREGNQCTYYVYKYSPKDRESGYREVCVDVYQGEDGHAFCFMYIREVTSRIEMERYADELVVKRDELFDVYNEAAFRQMVKGYIEDNPDAKDMFMIIDMDRFVMIKESFGELYAQSIMQNITSIIRVILPPEAVIAKVLADRLYVYLPHIERRDMASFVTYSIHKSINNVFTVEGRNYSLTPSIGATIGYEYTEHTFEQMLETANSRMLEAKKLSF